MWKFIDLKLSKSNLGLLFVFILFYLEKVSGNYFGVLAAESSSEKENFCIIYFPEFSPLPEEKFKANFHMLQDQSKLDLCNDHPEDDYKSKIILLTRHNCSLADQARVVQDLGGEGALFITPSGKVDHIEVNSSIAIDVNITVALISENSVHRLREMENTTTVCLFAPQIFGFDFSLLIIWIVAVANVAIGSYWSGIVRFKIYSMEISKLPEIEREIDSNKPTTKPNISEESSLNVSPFTIGIFVCCMGIMLVTLYFFFDYLVYFIIALFVLASIIAMYSCLEPLVLKLPCNWNWCRLFEFRFRNDASTHLDFRQILVLIFSIGLSTFWVVTRKEKYSWILQDILGVTFCIHMLKSIRLPSLKICALLLVLLFFYDIFFVFITPFLTGKGQSIMEEVATGGKSEEMFFRQELEKSKRNTLPMVLRVPHFSFDPLTVCYQQFSLLGFGDILVPGLLISYCHGFDLIMHKRPLYLPILVASYGIGLLVTFVGLFLMNKAQPALLYLVPATLFPPLILGYYRNELSLLWNGYKNGRLLETSVNPPEQTAAIGDMSNVELSPPDKGNLPVSFDNDIRSESINNAPELPIDIVGERKHLLR